MSDEIEMMRARLRECERERDAANEAACIYAERGARFADDADRYQRERDAARAEVARLTARLAEVEAGAGAAQKDKLETIAINVAVGNASIADLRAVLRGLGIMGAGA